MRPAPHASRRIRWTLSQAKRHLTAIRDGDESFGAYCRRRGLSYSRLAYWRKRLGDDGSRPGSAFVEISPRAVAPPSTASAHGPTAPGVTIRCAGGALILVATDFNPTVLRAVVAALS